MAAERQTKTTEAEINAALKLGLERRIIAEALKLVPELGDDIEVSHALTFAATSYLAIGERDKAIAVAEREDNSFESTAKVYMWLAEAEGVDSEFWPMAIEAADNCPFTPEYVEVHEMYGTVLLEAGRLDGIDDIARKAENEHLYAKVGLQYVEQGRLDLAIQLIQGSRAPGNAFVDLAHLCTRNGYYDTALMSLAHVVGDDIDANDIYCRIGEHFVENGDLKSAKDVLKRMVRGTGDRYYAQLDALIKTRGLVRQLGRYAARILFGQGESQQPESPESPADTIMSTVLQLLKEGDVNAALIATDGLESIIGDDALMRRRYSRLVLEPILEEMVKWGDLDGARALLDRVDPARRQEPLETIAAAEGPQSRYWVEALKDLDADPAHRIDNLEQLFKAVQAMQVDVGTDLSQLFNERVEVGNLLPTQVRLLGGAAFDSWRTFKDYDEVSFARLAHGATEIADSFMTDEERRAFIRQLATQFAAFRESGMYQQGAGKLVLQDLSEALASTNDPGAISELVQTMNANVDNAVGVRLIKSLVESGNAAAGAAGINVMSDADTPSEIYRYLLHKLAATGYLDEGLPTAITAAERSRGFPEWSTRDLITALHDELGVQLDAAAYVWVVDELRRDMPQTYAAMDRTQAESLLRERITGMIERTRTTTAELDRLPQDQLLSALANDEFAAIQYYFVHGGRTEYALVRHHNSSKFRAAVATAQEIQTRINPDLIRTELWAKAPAGWKEAMIDRRRPDESLVWQVEVSTTTEELRQTARNTTATVLGSELKWLIKHAVNGNSLPDNFSTMTDDVLLPDGYDRRLQTLLGPIISNVVEGREGNNATVGDFDKLKARIVSRISQFISDPTFASQAEDWRALQDQIRAENSLLASRHTLAVMARDPQITLRPSGAVSEWAGHVSGMESSVREAQRAGPENRTLTLRYLDGRDDFVELTRFADGAQCCFTSENTGIGQLDEDGRYRMRINRDPHWFVFSIEDTPPDAKKREASGFVFGSLGFINRQPAVLLNGIYMRRKTDTASNRILTEISERFADKLGVHYVAVAAVHGGKFNVDHTKWQIDPPSFFMLRPRAIEDVETEVGEQETYDDLGDVVNKQTNLTPETWVRRSDIARLNNGV